MAVDAKSIKVQKFKVLVHITTLANSLTMSTSSDESSASANQSFAMDELEQLIQRDLKYSRDSAVNDDLSAFDMKVNTLALVVTKLFKEMLLLRSNNDGLLTRLLDFQHFQHSENCKFDKFGDNVNKALENVTHLTEKLALQDKVLDSQYSMMCTMMDKITKLEKTSEINDRALLDLQQYVRRPTIEINGVSENIKQNDLENYVINQILKRTNGNNMNHRDIEAVHRIKKRDRSLPAPVVVRFCNRKDAIDAVLGKYKLKSVPHLGKIHIQNDLCPRFRAIFDELKALQNDGIVKQVWTFNGKIKYKTSNGRSGRVTRVSHENDLRTLKNTAELIKLERQAIIDLNNDSLNPPAPSSSDHHALNGRKVTHRQSSNLMDQTSANGCRASSSNVSADTNCPSLIVNTEIALHVLESEDLDPESATDMNALLADLPSNTARTDHNEHSVSPVHPVSNLHASSKVVKHSEVARLSACDTVSESPKIAENSNPAVPPVADLNESFKSLSPLA